MFENNFRINSKQKNIMQTNIINKEKNRTKFEFSEKTVFIMIKDTSSNKASFLKKLTIFEVRKLLFINFYIKKWIFLIRKEFYLILILFCFEFFLTTT